MTILDKIIAQKRKELVDLINLPLLKEVEKPVPTFKEQVASSSNMSIIAEIKRASPSKGAIDLTVDPIRTSKDI